MVYQHREPAYAFTGFHGKRMSGSQAPETNFQVLSEAIREMNKNNSYMQLYIHG